MAKRQQHGADPLGAHIRAHYKLLDSHAWRALSSSAKALWIDLRRQVGSSNNGTATTALEILKHRGWVSRNTVRHAAEELEALGFIRCTVRGGIAAGGKTPKLWAFTDLDTYEHPKRGISTAKATCDFLGVESLGQARAVLDELEATRALVKKNRKGQKLPLQRSETALTRPKLRAETAHVGQS